MKRTARRYFRALSLPTVLALSQLALPSALAASPTTEGEGSVFLLQYRKGMRFAQKEAWEDAIYAFQAAYDARSRPHPELLLYIAKAHLRLSQGGEALKFYAQFVAASSSPTEAQRQEVKIGMARAQALMESQAGRNKSRQIDEDEEDPASSTPGRRSTTRSVPKKEAQDASATKEETATSRDEHAKPTAPPEKTVRAVITGRKANIPYTVGVGSGDRLCTAPCELEVPPGPSTVTVSGPGSKQFQQSLAFPGVPFKMTVQHFTLSRAIAGPILIALSGVFLAGGVLINVAGRGSSAGSDAGAIAGAVPLYLHGAVFFFVGLGQLAAIKRNSIDIQPLAGTQAARPSPVRLASISVLPSASGRGAVASLGFRF